MQTFGTGCSGGQGNHTIAVVNVKQLCNRTQFMSRIVFAVSIEIVSQAVMAIFLASGDFVTQVVHVSARTVDDFAKQSCSNHIENHQFPATITAVFQQHDRSSGLFIGVHQFPAILNGISAANFQTDIFACFHRFHSQFDMSFPAGRDDDALNFRILQNLMLIFCFYRVFSCLFEDEFGSSLDTVCIRIVYCSNFHIVFLQCRQDCIFD